MDELRDRYRLPPREYPAPSRRPIVQYPHHEAPKSPAPAPVSPAPQPPAPDPYQPSPRPAAAQPVHKPKKRRAVKFFIFLVVLAALAGGGVLAYHKYNVKSPFPADIRQNADIDLLYPGQLPAGYKIDASSYKQTNGILTYNAYNSDQKLVFTLQKTPTVFDFNTFYKQQFQNSRQINTNYGTATLGINSGRPLGSLVDDTTWLLLSVSNNSHLSLDDLSRVMSNLKKD